MKTLRFLPATGMHRRSFLHLVAFTLSALAVNRLRAQPAERKPPTDDGKLRIIVFGAHPDDCELSAGGTGAKWAAQGHHVKFVSCTNGDIVVPIDDVVEKKLAAVAAFESQFYEGGCNGGRHLVPDPKDAAAVAARKKQVRDDWSGIISATANRFRSTLGQLYGTERAGKVKSAEAFEICEYGRKPDKDELEKLFPFFGE